MLGGHRFRYSDKSHLEQAPYARSGSQSLTAQNAIVLRKSRCNSLRRVPAHDGPNGRVWNANKVYSILPRLLTLVNTESTLAGEQTCSAKLSDLLLLKLGTRKQLASARSPSSFAFLPYEALFLCVALLRNPRSLAGYDRRRCRMGQACYSTQHPRHHPLALQR